MSINDWMVDIIITLGIFGISLLQLTASAEVFIPDSFTRRMLGINAFTPTLYGLFAVFLTVLPLVVRRKSSWGAFILSLSSWFFFDFQIGDAAALMLPVLIALASLSGLRNTVEAFIAALISLCTVVFMPGAVHQSVLSTLLLLQNFAFVIATTGGGMAFKMSRDLVKAANERARQAEQAASAETKRRLEEERVAIARELHDITAHSLSAISIQAAAAEAQLSSSVDEARCSIELIRKTSKDSLNEIRRMIGILREGDLDKASVDLAPSLGTENLSNIINYLSSAGVECELSKGNYDETQVPKYVDIAIYGIVREATTNIARHSHATTSSISISICDYAQGVYIVGDRQASRYVRLTVSDNGIGFKENDDKTGGHGIEGMRERVAALGGNFSIREGLHGGTILSATFPLINENNEN